jgi:hypothetical protein
LASFIALTQGTRCAATLGWRRSATLWHSATQGFDLG